jgi:hypothetical protein
MHVREALEYVKDGGAVGEVNAIERYARSEAVILADCSDG